MNDLYKIMIVEDEIMIASHIQQVLEEENFICVGKAKSYDEAIFLLEGKQHIDFVLLDVHLFGHKSGIDLAKQLKQNYHIPFFYLTSFADKETLTALRKTSPLGFLSKPVNEVELVTALQIAASNLKKNTFTLEVGNTQHIINLNDVYYIKSDHVYADIFLKDNTQLTVRIALKSLEEQLPENSLTRINRSVLVNPLHIQKVEKNRVYINNEEFSVSDKFAKKPLLDEKHHL